MPLDRPTYHESWYRIAGSMPRLRSVVQCERQRFRGQTWHVLRDPSTNRFFRVHESAYRFVGLLDGRRTVDRAWAAVSESFGDEAPTQGEAIGLLGQLYASNLLEGDLAPDAEALFKRHRKRVNREVGGYLMNLLFARFPVFDPDNLLNRWLPVVGWCFGPVGLMGWLAMIMVGLWSLIGRFPQLTAEAQSVLNAQNLPLLYGATILSKLLHELGHGFACKRYGLRQGSAGEVHTLGIMLIVLIPMPYVDASSASALRSKWQRAFIGAAGMYVDLALAAIAAVLWSRSAQGTLTHEFVYNLIFVAGVSALLFNANPLIKFDGYFILSDLLEMPNLQQRGRETLAYLWKKWVAGVRRPHRAFHSPAEFMILLIYAIAAFIYRIFLSITIMLFVAGQMLIVGVIMAIAGAIGMVVTPLGKAIRYLFSSPELSRTRPRALIGTAAMLAAAIAACGLIRLPTHGRAEGVTEPVDLAVVYAQVEGRLTEAPMPQGPVGDTASTLVSLDNPELRFQLQELEAKRREFVLRRHMASRDDPAAALAMDAQIGALDEQLEDLRQDIAKLQVHSPIAGVWSPNDVLRRMGQPIQRGQELGVVASVDRLIIRAAADQFLGPRIAREVEAGSVVPLRVRGRSSEVFQGRVVAVLPAGQRQLPSMALSKSAGGSIALDPTPGNTPGNSPGNSPGSTPENSTGTESARAAEPYFEVVIDLPPEDAQRLLPGQRVVARFRLHDISLLQRVYLAARQVLQERFQI